jgi:hypothetical protein
LRIPRVILNDEHGANDTNQKSRRKDFHMSASSETWQLGSQSVQVTHLEKRYWSTAKFTKGDMLRYYVQIAPVALPYFKDRPVTLRVFPQGVSGESYYLRDCPDAAPGWLQRVDYHTLSILPIHHSHCPSPSRFITDERVCVFPGKEGVDEYDVSASL